jgi:Caudovirales tail fibre assembly protein.
MTSQMYFSKKDNSFYSGELHDDYVLAGTWPDDAAEISEELYQSLLAGQLNGKVITSDSDGNPVLADPVIDWNARAESQRQNLLTAADDTIADWRTELQLDVISDDDKASLIKWMAYIKALKRLDLTSVTDEAGYNAIEWPDKPE